MIKPRLWDSDDDYILLKGLTTVTDTATVVAIMQIIK